MRATEIIRGVLDLIDQINREPSEVDDTSHEESRFKQILAMISVEPTSGEYANSPNEIVSGVDSVTVDAGGGVNGPKHPADLRVKDPRGYA
jgi:hypothetical protein